MNTVRKRTEKSKRTARLRTKMAFAPKAHGMINRFTVMPPALKRRSKVIPAESAEALARVVAAADLAERGLITVTSTKGMSSEEFFALIKASSPTK